MSKHGWIEKRDGPKGISFRVRYWAPNASGVLVQRSRSFAARRYGGKAKAEAAAKTFLAEQITRVGDGSYLVPTETTLRQLVDQWLAAREGQVSDSTIYNYRSALKHLDAETGAIPIQRLKALHLQALYGRLRAAGVGIPVTDLLHTVIGAALAQAVKWELLNRNPAHAVTRPERRRPQMRYWTPEQAAAFLASAGDDVAYGALWQLALETGMRRGELLALRWDDLDVERQTITIQRTITRDRAGVIVIGETTKTRRSRRTIHLPSPCLEPLKQQRIRQRERRLAAPVWSTADGDLVFSRADGRFLHPQTVAARFAAAAAACGLPVLGLHGMRHSFVTAMLLDGVPANVVAEIVGDTVDVVLRVYAHVTESSRQDAVERFAVRLEGLRAAHAGAQHATTADG